MRYQPAEIPCDCGESFSEGSGLTLHQRKCQAYRDARSPHTITCSRAELKIACELMEAIDWATKGRARLVAAERELVEARENVVRCDAEERTAIEAADRIGLTLRNPAEIHKWKRAPRNQ